MRRLTITAIALAMLVAVPAQALKGISPTIATITWVPNSRNSNPSPSAITRFRFAAKEISRSQPRPTASRLCSRAARPSNGMASLRVSSNRTTESGRSSISTAPHASRRCDRRVAAERAKKGLVLTISPNPHLAGRMSPSGCGHPEMARRGKYGNACLVCDKGKAVGVRIIC